MNQPDSRRMAKQAFQAALSQPFLSAFRKEINMPEVTNDSCRIKYLRLPELLALLGVSWVTVWRWEKQGLFPKRRKLGPRIVGWREDEILEWCANREPSL